MICMNCGTDVPDGSTHCLTCGAPMSAPAAPACVYCGTPLTADSVFCTNCGNQQPVADAPVEEPAMPNVCPHCGSTLAEDSAFCTICGNAVTAAPAAPVEETPKKTRAPKTSGTSFLDKLPVPKNVAIFGGAGVLTLLLVVIILCVALSGGGAEGVALDYMEAYLDGDADAMMELIHADVLDEYFDSKSDRNDAIDNLEDNLDSALDELEDEYGEDWDYSVEVIYVNEAPDDELRDTNKSYKRSYGLQVEEMAEVILLVEFEGEDGDYGRTRYVTVIKIDGDWYLKPGTVF